ncbi:MAG: DNA polymerase III subunit chi [Gammaproteobacteria bacterium]|nr:DNA polymerase III subunit chi [Gammaproteobacteria bacterium]
MNKKAVFYILEDAETKSHSLCAARLAEKAYAANRSIYILVNDADEAYNLDTSLWTFRDISFVPHAIYNNNPNPVPQVLIGYKKNPPPTHIDVLINLTAEIPSFYHEFAHIIEIVTNEQKSRALSREHYKFYKQEGFTLETHNV